MAKKMEYFKHDVNASKDRKIQVLILKHGKIAYANYFMLLESIYRNDEPVVDMSDENVLLGYSADMDMKPNELLDFIDDCVELDLFNAERWSDGELTSNGILRRFEDNKRYYESRAKGAEIANKKMREKRAKEAGEST